MLYNKETKKLKEYNDCYSCPFYDKIEKRCKGLGKRCFEYDTKTGIVIDPITKLPIKF